MRLFFVSGYSALSLLLLVPMAKAGDADFTVHRKLVLAKKTDGFDGSLEVWRDKRLTDADLKIMREHDPDSDPANGPRFKAVPVKPAVIRLKSEDGHLIQSLILEKPMAEIEAKNIGMKGQRIFLVTQDFGIGMGSYNGPITRILEVTPKSAAWAEALDRRSGKKTRISLMRSLKSAWSFTPAKTGGVEDILEARSYPDETSDGFTTSFSRYHRDRRGWTTRVRTEPGLWESEDDDGRVGYSLPAPKVSFPPGFEETNR